MKNEYLEALLYESDNDPVGLPDGVSYLSDEKGKSIEHKIDKIADIYKNAGYQRVNPPIFEYYETFEKGSGSSIARKSFSFKDKEGKMLSLRYDMTTPIARMAAMRYEKEELPLRLYYRGDVFREQPLHTGKPRQLKQIGIELIGKGDWEADVEAINLLGESLAALSKHYTIVLGDIRLFKHLLSQLKLSSSLEQAINAAFIIKDVTSLQKIIRDAEGIQQYKEMLIRIPNIVGDLKQVKRELDSYAELGISLYLERLSDIVKNCDGSVRKNIIIDMGLIKDFSYYSSTTIEGYIEGVGSAVANGGRYDELFKSFGKDFPAIGFAVDMSYYN